MHDDRFAPALPDGICESLREAEEAINEDELLRELRDTAGDDDV